MRAWLLQDFTGLTALRLVEDARDPVPASNEVLLRVRFAALNPADRFLAESLYPAKPPLPHVLGRDGTGEVVAVGDKVSSQRVGDRVLVLRGETGVMRWGTLAELAAVPAESVAGIPEGWSDEQAAAAPLVYLTAHQALKQWGALNDAAVLITGASGGVGLASIHLAKGMGHRVIGLSREEAKRQRLVEEGADLVTDPGDDQLKRKIKDFTGGRGVDLVVENVAGPLFNTLLDVMAQYGRISVVGMLGGNVPNFSTAKLLFRRTRIGGVQVGDRTAQEARHDWAEVVAMLSATGKKPVVDSVFPFAALHAAFDRLAAGPFGKVVVQVGG